MSNSHDSGRVATGGVGGGDGGARLAIRAASRVARSNSSLYTCVATRCALARGVSGKASTVVGGAADEDAGVVARGGAAV